MSSGTRSDPYRGYSRTVMFLLARNCRMLSRPNLFYFSDIPESSVIIFQTLFNWFTINRTVNRRLTHTIYFTYSLDVDLPVEGITLLKSSFTSDHSFGTSCPTQKIRVRNIALFPYNCWSCSSACDWVFSNQIKIFMFFVARNSSFVSRCSIAKRAEKDEV